MNVEVDSVQVEPTPSPSQTEKRGTKRKLDTQPKSTPLRRSKRTASVASSSSVNYCVDEASSDNDDDASVILTQRDAPKPKDVLE